MEPVTDPPDVETLAACRDFHVPSTCGADADADADFEPFIVRGED